MQGDTYLAFDLGAESGRAITGRLSHGRLEIAEVARFPNEPLQLDGSLRWNVPALWAAMTHALSVAGPADRLASVGVDAWGCDYALLGQDGAVLEPPFHYRDRRTEHAMADVFGRVPAAAIHHATGCQFLPFNTLFQLDVARRTSPDLLERAATLVTMPDLFNYWLTGRITSEYTIATTTQLVDPRTRTWAVDLADTLALPRRLFAPIVEAGTILGPAQASIAPIAGTPVVAPACHDTGSAVAAVEATGETVFLSSGTWSLLGTERRQPIITNRVHELNFTNEGGVAGTTRLLKNIAGLWLLQGCRRVWSGAGLDVGYGELLQSADHVPPFASLIDPDDPVFLNPPSMPAAIDHYCDRSRQARPTSPAAYARTVLESLAFKYRVVIEWLEELTGTHVATIRVIGGGARNRLLNQFTADATGRTVLAGPVEATALGNIAMQMVALGAVSSIEEARALIQRSFPVERFDPIAARRWDHEYRRFREFVELNCA